MTHLPFPSEPPSVELAADIPHLKEKLHEVLISEDESRTTVELESMFVVQPAEALWFGYSWQEKGKLLQDDFRYASDNNSEWLDLEGIRKYIAPFEQLFAKGELEG